MSTIQAKTALLAALYCMTAPACALSGEAVSGVVLDKASGQAIPGALVIASWNGHRASLAHGESVCYHVETGTADAAGTFRIPAWSEGFSLRGAAIGNRMVDVEAFKPGYIRSERAYWKGGKVFLLPKGQADYFAYIEALSKRSICPGAGESRKNLYRLFVALVAEAGGAAQTRAQRESVVQMARIRDSFLVNMKKPAAITGSGVVNIIPADSDLKEDLGSE